jgi:phosphate-selective porin OprO/OprP
LRPSFLANPVRLRIGAWAQPANLEDATSNTEGLFLERPDVAELNRAIAAGDGRAGIGVNINGDRWYAGGALTGDLVGQGSASATPVSDEQTGYTARLAYALLKGPNHALHLGANFNGVIDPQDTGAGLATVKNIRLRERPELRVDDTRLVDTGAIASDGISAYGAEIGANWKNFYGAGEYFRFDLNRSGVLSDPKFNGWYVHGAWTLTGEHHVWNAAAGGFKGIKPANEFDPSNGRWGAWELAARYSDLDLNFHEGVVGAAAPADGIRGGEQKISTVGLNFYPNAVLRFLLDFQHAQIDRIGAGNAKVHDDFDAVSLRTQVAF